MSEPAAERLLDKIRNFVSSELDAEERALFGALVAFGLGVAYPELDPEVQAFDMVWWSGDALPKALVEALRRTGVTVSGLGPPPG
jgi:hypothetical protein